MTGRDGRPVITVAEAALLTGRSQATIRSWVARRHLRPVAHVGGRGVFAIEDVWDVERATRRRARAGRPRRAS